MKVKNKITMISIQKIKNHLFKIKNLQNKKSFIFNINNLNNLLLKT
jgi:hypothetical protein